MLLTSFEERQNTQQITSTETGCNNEATSIMATRINTDFS